MEITFAISKEVALTSETTFPIGTKQMSCFWIK